MFLLLPRCYAYFSLQTCYAYFSLQTLKMMINIWPHLNFFAPPTPGCFGLVTALDSELFALLRGKTLNALSHLRAKQSTRRGGPA